MSGPAPKYMADWSLLEKIALFIIWPRLFLALRRGYCVTVKSVKKEGGE